MQKKKKFSMLNDKFKVYNCEHVYISQFCTAIACESMLRIGSDLSFLITVVRVIRLRLIWQPSLSLAPSACVCEALSLPARSTKFCKSLVTQ
jgi:hypothetical protein